MFGAMAALQIAVILAGLHCILGVGDTHPHHPNSVLTDPECDVSLCTQPLEKFHLEKLRVTPTFNRSELDEICRLYGTGQYMYAKEVRSCFENVRKECRIGVVDPYQYLCAKQYGGYFNHYECRSKPEVNQNAGECLATFNKEAINPKDGAYRRDELCSLVRTYVDCVADVLAKYCGKEAADWQRKLDWEMMKPMLSLTNCGPSLEIVMYGIIGILGGIVLIALVIAFIIEQNRGKNVDE